MSPIKKSRWSHDAMRYGDQVKSKLIPMFQGLNQRNAYKLARRLIDDTFRRYRKDPNNPKIACRKRNCFSCCLYQVGINSSRYEAERILDQVERENRLPSVVKHAQRLVDGGRGGACPLLSPTGQCTVYNIRPLVCAAQHSMDAEACRDPKGSFPYSDVLDIEVQLIAAFGMTPFEKWPELKDNMPDLFHLLADLGRERLNKKEAA